MPFVWYSNFIFERLKSKAGEVNRARERAEEGGRVYTPGRMHYRVACVSRAQNKSAARPKSIAHDLSAMEWL